MKKKKLCMISSSGGHFEQLSMLKKLSHEYQLFWVTEKTEYHTDVDYLLPQTGLKDSFFVFKMIENFLKTMVIWMKERPDAVITTGTMVALPMCFFAKFFGKKIIYIETFARVYDGTKAGKLMYKYADVFIIQWESLKEIYPNAIYGGSIY